MRICWLQTTLDQSGAEKRQSPTRVDDPATRIFEELTSEGTSIVADLSQVSFLDTTIIHALVVGRNLAESAEVGFATCLPEGHVARRMLELMRVLEVLPAATSVDAAIASALSARKGPRS